MPIASEESEVDIEVEAMEDSSEEEDFEGKEDEEAGEDELEESENEPANDSQSVRYTCLSPIARVTDFLFCQTGMGRTAPLRIKLKLGAQPPPSRRFARAKSEGPSLADNQ
jgi:hypothetical protein